MANYQNITPVKLGQAAMTAAYAVIYTTAPRTKTYLKQFDIANTTGGALSVFIHLVPAAGSVGTDNALVYNVSVAALNTLQWTGVQILDEGDTIQIKASAVGCTITASGGEAV